MDGEPAHQNSDILGSILAIVGFDPSKYVPVRALVITTAWYILENPGPFFKIYGFETSFTLVGKECVSKLRIEAQSAPLLCARSP